MLRFSFKVGGQRQRRAFGLGGTLLGCVLLGGWLLGCTVTPDYFPPCVNPYVDTCPFGDASPDGEDPDGGAESTPDATASGPAFDATFSAEGGQVTM